MATKSKTSAQSTVRKQPQQRAAITFEKVQMLAPTDGQAEKIATTFALDPIDYAGIREGTEQHLVHIAGLLPINEVALKIHVQRLVGAHIASAFRAGEFYSTRITVARDTTTKLTADNRDEDSDGVYGFESRAARARQFAAEAGLQAYALMAAAEGALRAYAHLTGEEWKPYEQPTSPTALTRQVAEAELAAFSG